MTLSRLTLPGKLAITFGLAMFFILVTSTFANAQGQTERPPAPGYVPQQYIYTVEKDNNYTLLIRKSIQLYDLADESIELNQAQTVFTETNIANVIQASDLILVNEEIRVASDLIAEYTEKAITLDSAAIDAWQFYANRADFSLNEISPNNVQVDKSGAVTEAIAEDSSDQASETKAADTEESSENDDSNSSFWWIIGGATVIVLWYLLWQRGEDTDMR